MGIVREFALRLWGSLAGRRSDRDIEEEIQSHVQHAADDVHRRDGEGGRAARLAAGGSSQAVETMRDQRGLPWLEDLLCDLRLVLRTLGRAPMFTAVTTLTLALGIGANTAIFTVVNGVLSRPLQYADADQLMYLNTSFPQFGLPEFFASPPEYMEFREVNTSFSAVGAYRLGELNLTGSDRPVRVRAAFVDTQLLSALSVQPAVGRLFAAGETEVTGGEPVPGQPTPLPPSLVVLSYDLWQNAFAGAPVLGREVEIEGRRREVIGVMAPGVDLMDGRVEIWLPLGLNPANRQNRGSHSLFMIGRLKDTVTPEGARAELATLMPQWGARLGVTGNHVLGAGLNRDHVFQMRPLAEQILGTVGRSLWMLQAAVGFVLLIAYANLANLFLARAQARRHEFAVRVVLGAGGGRLVRQLVTEGVALSLCGGVIGVLLADLAVRALVTTYPDSLPRTSELALRPTAWLFAFALSVVSGVVFGLTPIMHTRIRRLAAALSTRGADAAGRGHHSLRRGLVTAEVALAVVVVIGAGLLVRTVYNLTSVDAGFNETRLVTFSVSLPQVSYPQPAARNQALQRLLEKVRALPGVERVTAMSGLPPSRRPNAQQWQIPGRVTTTQSVDPVVEHVQVVMSDYFDTMAIPIVAGRVFEPGDASSQGRVVVVNEVFARTFWLGQNPIGQRLRQDGGDQIPWSTVIGVVRDVKQNGLAEDVAPELYIFAEQVQTATPATMNVMLRTTLDVDSLDAALQDAVAAVDRSVPMVKLRQMETVFAESISRARLLAQLMGGFALLALLLAAVGVYGVLSYLVAERRREIGIRMALGADRVGVVRQVLKEGLILTGVAVLIGVAAAGGVNRMIASMLYDVEPTDPTTIAAAVTATVLVATISCLIPAWRASRLDPNIALRAD